MKYVIYIENDASQLIRVFPDVSNITNKNSQESGGILSRIDISGDFVFYDNDYTFLNSLTRRKTNIIIYQNGHLLATGTVDLTQSKDISFNKMALSIKIEDDYTPFVDLGNTEYNVLNAPSYSVKILNQSSIEFFSETINVDLNLTFGGATVGWYYYLNYDGDANIFGTSNSATPLLPDEVNYIGGTFSKMIFTALHSYTYIEGGIIKAKCNTNIELEYYSFIQIGVFIDGAPIAPAGTGWQYYDTIIINGVLYPKFRKPLSADQYTISWSNNSVSQITTDVFTTIKFSNNSATISVIEPEDAAIYTTARKFEEVIKYLVDQIDPTISVNASSFSYFNNYTGEALRYEPFAYNLEINRPFDNIMLFALSDAIPNANGTQKSGVAITGLLTFNKTIDFLKARGFVWYIENKTFYLKHRTELSLSSGNPSLLNYYGVNWLKRNMQIEYSEPTFNRIKNNETGGDLEFLGVDVLFPNINTLQLYEFGQETFYNDINHIRNVKADVYSDVSNDQFVIAACQDYTDENGNDLFIIRQATGLLTGRPVNNSELSFSFIAEKMLSELPDNVAEINYKTLNIENTRLEKREKLSFNVPVYQLNNDINFFNLIDVYGQTAEVESLEHSAISNLGRLTVKK